VSKQTRGLAAAASCRKLLVTSLYWRIAGRQRI